MAMPLAGRERGAAVEGVQLQTAIEHGADGLQHFVGIAALQEGSGGLSPHGFSSFLLGEMMKTLDKRRKMASFHLPSMDSQLTHRITQVR